jgi:Flp pilus assembly protein TadG
MRRSQRGKRGLLRRTEGAMAVEFAIVLPILLLIVGGIMDIGHAYHELHVVNEAAREGARVAAVGGSPQEIGDAITNFGDQLQYTINPSPPVSGSNVTVSVSTQVQLFTPIISAFFPNNPFTVTGTTIMRVE